MNFTGKTIWITGASSGIGKGIAIELSHKNTHLILSGRKKEVLNEVATICRENGSSVKVVPFDLGDENEIKEAVKSVLDDEIKVDCLLNIGGVSQRSLIIETPLNVDRKLFEINYFGVIALTKAILPSMIKNGGGLIAATSSIVGKFGFPYRSSYAASKHALHGFFESLRAEHITNNIRVSIIIPGRIKTNISLNAIDKDGNKHLKMDEGQDKGKSVTDSAKVICRKLQIEKKEILVGGKELLMVHIRRFLPSLYYYLASRIKPS